MLYCSVYSGSPISSVLSIKIFKWLYVGNRMNIGYAYFVSVTYKVQ